MKKLNPNDKVIVYSGDSRIPGLLLRTISRDVWEVRRLDIGKPGHQVVIHAHRNQMRRFAKARKYKTLWISRTKTIGEHRTHTVTDVDPKDSKNWMKVRVIK